ncbi:MAG: metal ABC transporter substrate-binding protein [Dehalococcoidia bacterium]|nr:metal ABC transporter substrate-binding protein [Dehalococcoidia bacterium]
MKAVIVTLIMALVLILSAGCQGTDSSRLGVVTSTSLIASIVERVGGDRVGITNLIPPAQCPGHFDVTPGDVRKLADADIFFYHGWQGETFSEELISSAKNPGLTVVNLQIQGNWLVPGVHLQAIDLITEALAELDPDGSEEYRAAASEYKNSVQAAEVEFRNRLEREHLEDIRILGAEMLDGFLEWTGLDLIATYGRADSLTPQVVRVLVDTAREAQVSLIVDNLQSGQDTGAGMAQDLNCARVVLTNFPGGFPNTDTWEKTVDHNLELILGVLGR